MNYYLEDSYEDKASMLDRIRGASAVAGLATGIYYGMSVLDFVKYSKIDTEIFKPMNDLKLNALKQRREVSNYLANAANGDYLNVQEARNQLLNVDKNYNTQIIIGDQRTLSKDDFMREVRALGMLDGDYDTEIDPKKLQHDGDYDALKDLQDTLKRLNNELEEEQLQHSIDALDDRKNKAIQKASDEWFKTRMVEHRRMDRSLDYFNLYTNPEYMGAVKEQVRGIIGSTESGVDPTKLQINIEPKVRQLNERGSGAFIEDFEITYSFEKQYGNGNVSTIQRVVNPDDIRIDNKGYVMTNKGSVLRPTMLPTGEFWVDGDFNAPRMDLVEDFSSGDITLKERSVVDINSSQLSTPDQLRTLSAGYRRPTYHAGDGIKANSNGVRNIASHTPSVPKIPMYMALSSSYGVDVPSGVMTNAGVFQQMSLTDSMLQRGVLADTARGSQFNAAVPHVFDETNIHMRGGLIDYSPLMSTRGSSVKNSVSGLTPRTLDYVNDRTIHYQTAILFDSKTINDGSGYLNINSPDYKNMPTPIGVDKNSSALPKESMKVQINALKAYLHRSDETSLRQVFGDTIYGQVKDATAIAAWDPKKVPLHMYAFGESLVATETNSANIRRSLMELSKLDPESAPIYEEALQSLDWMDNMLQGTKVQGGKIYKRNESNAVMLLKNQGKKYLTGHNNKTSDSFLAQHMFGNVSALGKAFIHAGMYGVNNAGVENLSEDNIFGINGMIIFDDQNRAVGVKSMQAVLNTQIDPNSLSNATAPMNMLTGLASDDVQGLRVNAQTIRSMSESGFHETQRAFTEAIGTNVDSVRWFAGKLMLPSIIDDKKDKYLKTAFLGVMDNADERTFSSTKLESSILEIDELLTDLNKLNNITKEKGISYEYDEQYADLSLRISQKLNELRKTADTEKVKYFGIHSRQLEEYNKLASKEKGSILNNPFMKKHLFFDISALDGLTFSDNGIVTPGQDVMDFFSLSALAIRAGRVDYDSKGKYAGEFYSKLESLFTSANNDMIAKSGLLNDAAHVSGVVAPVKTINSFGSSLSAGFDEFFQQRLDRMDFYYDGRGNITTHARKTDIEIGKEVSDIVYEPESVVGSNVERASSGARNASMLHNTGYYVQEYNNKIDRLYAELEVENYMVPEDDNDLFYNNPKFDRFDQYSVDYSDVPDYEDGLDFIAEVNEQRDLSKANRKHNLRNVKKQIRRFRNSKLYKDTMDKEFEYIKNYTKVSDGSSKSSNKIARSFRNKKAKKQKDVTIQRHENIVNFIKTRERIRMMQFGDIFDEKGTITNKEALIDFLNKNFKEATPEEIEQATMDILKGSVEFDDSTKGLDKFTVEKKVDKDQAISVLEKQLDDYSKQEDTPNRNKLINDIQQQIDELTTLDNPELVIEEIDEDGIRKHIEKKIDELKKDDPEYIEKANELSRKIKEISLYRKKADIDKNIIQQMRTDIMDKVRKGISETVEQGNAVNEVYVPEHLIQNYFKGTATYNKIAKYGVNGDELFTAAIGLREPYISFSSMGSFKVKTFGKRDVFNILRQTYQSSDEFQQHVLANMFGRDMFSETDDPDEFYKEWIDKIYGNDEPSEPILGLGFEDDGNNLIYDYANKQEEQIAKQNKKTRTAFNTLLQEIGKEQNMGITVNTINKMDFDVDTLQVMLQPDMDQTINDSIWTLQKQVEENISKNKRHGKGNLVNKLTELSETLDKMKVDTTGLSPDQVVKQYSSVVQTLDSYINDEEFKGLFGDYKKDRNLQVIRNTIDNEQNKHTLAKMIQTNRAVTMEAQVEREKAQLVFASKNKEFGGYEFMNSSAREKYKTYDLSKATVTELTSEDKTRMKIPQNLPVYRLEDTGDIELKGFTYTQPDEKMKELLSTYDHVRESNGGRDWDYVQKAIEENYRTQRSATIFGKEAMPALYKGGQRLNYGFSMYLSEVASRGSVDYDEYTPFLKTINRYGQIVNQSGLDSKKAGITVLLPFQNDFEETTKGLLGLTSTKKEGGVLELDKYFDTMWHGDYSVDSQMNAINIDQLLTRSGIDRSSDDYKRYFPELMDITNNNGKPLGMLTMGEILEAKASSDSFDPRLKTNMLDYAQTLKDKAKAVSLQQAVIDENKPILDSVGSTVKTDDFLEQQRIDYMNRIQKLNDVSTETRKGVVDINLLTKEAKSGNYGDVTAAAKQSHIADRLTDSVDNNVAMNKLADILLSKDRKFNRLTGSTSSLFKNFARGTVTTGGALKFAALGYVAAKAMMDSNSGGFFGQNATGLDNLAKIRDDIREDEYKLSDMKMRNSIYRQTSRRPFIVEKYDNISEDRIYNIGQGYY